MGHVTKGRSRLRGKGKSRLRGKGNVFEVLGFGREEAADPAMKTDLASALRTFIGRQKLTQEKAAKFFDVSRPKISQIQNNKLQGISIEYLVRMLAKTGGKLSYSFRQPSKQIAKARLSEHANTTAA